jgi:hypothetical protein
MTRETTRIEDESQERGDRLVINKTTKSSSQSVEDLKKLRGSM